MNTGSLPRIPFNVPALTGREQEFLEQVFRARKFSGDGPMAQRCNAWLREHFQAPGAFVTTSCTHALEMAAMLCDLGPGDEVILPSFAFSSTATAFARTGARLVFVDIDPATMNVDPACVAAAIGPATKAIVALHYGGVGCVMEALGDLAARHDIFLVEDAAQCMFARRNGRPLGSIGTFGCISFHESKNLHCGEGGALVVNDAAFIPRAEIILEKGTDRVRFKREGRGKYTWMDIGSSYVLSDLNCAFLMAQFEGGAQLTRGRLATWHAYRAALEPLHRAGKIELPPLRSGDEHNGHIAWFKARDVSQREALIEHLAAAGIMATFHYIPLHSAPAGPRFGRFAGEDRFTTRESERLLRLPIYSGFDSVERVVGCVARFFDANP